MGANGRTAAAAHPGLGTFAGVFTPSILTILGIILFLRLGYVVGNAGLGRALLIIGLANLISILTSVSLAAIATNLKVKGGGDYYLISRTLGLEYGGAIGVLLFLAQSVSIAFYCVGFGDAVQSLLGASSPSPRVIAVSAIAALFILAWYGATIATRFQYLVMGVMTLALLSFFAGAIPGWEASQAVRNWSPPSEGLPFWVLFAIFFPAVTGFTQGVSMSGDLRDASRSMPLGTFLAVGVSALIYFSVAILYAGRLPNATLADDYQAMWQVARLDSLIHAGVIAATLSSAMASFLGAPRILQSLASDRTLPLTGPFAAGHGPANNPRRALLLSLGIALVTTAVGNLNTIAPLVSMFFLVSYGLLNYATFFEARSNSPSFRPRLRYFDRRISFLGFLACAGTMLAIDLTAGLFALLALFAVYQYLRRTAGPAPWVDSRRAFYLQQIKENLLEVASEPEHPRNWRPQLLAIAETGAGRNQLLDFASWLDEGSGITTVIQLTKGTESKAIQRRRKLEAQLAAEISKKKVHAYGLVVTTTRTRNPLFDLVQAYGIGPLKANTLLACYPDLLTREEDAETLQLVYELGVNLVLLNGEARAAVHAAARPDERATIDIWWWNDASSQLMLLLAYLMTRDERWHHCDIRLLAACYPEDSPALEARLAQTLEEFRIDARSEIIPHADEKAIASRSANAAMVFLPFRFRDGRVRLRGSLDADGLLPHLPLTALVLAAEDIDLDAAPEEGRPVEVVTALEEIEQALHSLETGAGDNDTLSLKRMLARLEQLRKTFDPTMGSDILERMEKVGRELAAALEKR
jgi:amino acid transporter